MEQLHSLKFVSSTTTLADIPREVFYLISTWLTGTDIENLGKCNRAFRTLVQDEYLWSVMTRVRFPRLYHVALDEMSECPNEPRCWRELYMAKDHCQISAAQNMEMIHNRLPYWRTERTNESIYGATVKLHSVCWFDISGVIEGVPPGRYRIQWRTRLSLSARWNEPLDYVARTLQGGAELCYTTPSDFYAREDVVTNTWILLTIPGELVIKDEWGFTDVRLSHEKRTNYWKSGIEIDWVRLIPADQAIGDGLLIDYESRHTFYWRSRTSSSSHDLTAEGKLSDNGMLLSPSWSGEDSEDGSGEEFWA
ncbi:hypothetical protein BJV82DRAFT_631613 [Fennellomyces sp. T-0311]|nr:hypothetical protein BJV82DRAFT_631613 [Fennellomyces sp. T-0311]